jgi:hypothetical protein
MKRVLFLFSLMLLSVQGFSQQAAYTLGLNAGNVDCYYVLDQCNGKTVVLLRFDNRNSSPVTISWEEQFTTVQMPQWSPGIKTKQMVLPVGVTELTGCGDPGNRLLIIHGTQVSHTYVADITGFAYTNVTVAP